MHLSVEYSKSWSVAGGRDSYIQSNIREQHRRQRHFDSYDHYH
jgi:hypothetical protein